MIILFKKVLKPLGFIRAKIREKIYFKISSFFVVSFPKSGRTWLRVFLAKYFSLFFGIPMSLHFVYLSPKRRNIPKITFSHGNVLSAETGAMEKDVKCLANKKIIFMVRDPRDVVVSYFFQQKKRASLFGGASQLGGAESLSGISDFIRHNILGIDRIIDFMNLWYENRGKAKDMILIKYEDCLSRPREEFGKALDFLGVRTDKNKLDEAVEYSSFENMKKLEERDVLGDDRLRPGDPNDPESFKVRKGKAGGFRDYLSAEDIEYVNGRFKWLNSVFGYTL